MKYKMSEGHSYISDTFIFDRAIYESEKPGAGLSSAVLRVIKGPVAEWGGLNRNTRKYSEKLWDRVLAAPYLVEQLKYKSLFGEANHPVDRDEIDFARVSHLISELWKVPDKNQIWTVLWILDTPLGRILDTLYEAGSLIGYSSRAGGLLLQRKDYIEVDADTYNFITFDAVPYPSVECARPGVLESVEHKFELSDETHEKLITMINESRPYDREIIREFIYGLRGYDMSREIQVFESVNNPVLNRGNGGTVIVPATSQVNESGNNDLGLEPDDLNKPLDSGSGQAANAESENEGQKPEQTTPTDNKSADDSKSQETTLSLLKENLKQIERLKSTEQSLIATRDSLIKENRDLKDSLSTAFSRISKLMEDAQNAGKGLAVDPNSDETENKNPDNNEKARTTQYLDDTIKEMKRRVSELEDALDDKELELEELLGVREAARALKYENERLRLLSSAGKSGTSSSGQQTAAPRLITVNVPENGSGMTKELQDEIDDLKQKLEESYKEIADMVDEMGKRDELISDLESKVRTLKLVRARLTKNNEQLQGELSNAEGEVSEKVATLEGANQRLREEVSSVNESLDSARRQSDHYRKNLASVSESLDSVRKQAERYKRELVSVICGTYNISEEVVRPRLRAGFTKADVYSICESISNEASRKASPMIIGEYSESGTVSGAAEASRQQSFDGQHLKARVSLANRRGTVRQS